MNINEDNKYWLRVNIESGSNDTPVKCQTTGTKIVRNVLFVLYLQLLSNVSTQRSSRRLDIIVINSVHSMSLRTKVVFILEF